MSSLARRLFALCVMLSLGLISACGGGGSSTPAGSALSSAKAITAFSFLSVGATGTISEPTRSIAVNVPFGTNVTALVASFSTTGRRVRVGATTQVSGVTANDFTSPVVYTVSAADGTSVNYTVTVTVLPFSALTSKTLQTFELNGVSGAIDETAKTVTVLLPPDGTNVTALAAVFTHNGASVSVGGTPQASGVTVNNFTNPVVYTVTAQDSSTSAYTVTVSFLVAPKLLTAFSITSSGATGTINQGARTVLVTLPVYTYSTTASYAALVASFETSSGAMVKVGSTVQTSGSTSNNFAAGPLTYTVIAPDGLTQNYTVTAIASSPSFSSFYFWNSPSYSVIDNGIGAIALRVPAGTLVTGLSATFETANTTNVTVGGTMQTSGVTLNNFTSPVIYTLNTVTAIGVPKNYTATVTVAPGLRNPAVTGQAVIYATGDDGYQHKGVPPPLMGPSPMVVRFLPVSSGTGTVVIDGLTGLVWAWNGKTPAFGTCTGGAKTWAAALTYVACLNANNYLTFSDWRLPNVLELSSIVTASQPNTYAWLNSRGFAVEGNIYFSSTTDAAITSQARVVNFVTGNVIEASKTDSLGVLPVRGVSTAYAAVMRTGQTTTYAAGDDGSLQTGLAWPSPRFTNPGGTTPISGSLVEDQLTGLMWPRDAAPASTLCSLTSSPWQQALDYVSCLNANTFLGYTDWRLPNVIEMASLLNAGQADTSAWLNTQGFTNVDGNGYWTSTTDPTLTDNAWLIFLSGGDKDSAAKTSTGSGNFRAWPVRAGY